MQGKFIIFVLVANLAQSSFALPLNVTYGLTEDALVDLNEIVSRQDVALKAMYEGFDPLFDILQKSASSLINDRGVRAKPSIVPTVRKARLSARKAWDQCLDAVLIAVGGSCSAVEEARKVTHANLVTAYDAINSLLSLADSGRTSAALQAVALHHLTDSKEQAYNSMRICAHIEDPNQLAIVQQVENQSRLTLTHLANALFNAMNVYGTAVSAGKADVSLIYIIEDCRQQTLDGVRMNMATGFGAVKAFYIYSQVEQTEILLALFLNQFTLAMGTHNFEAMAEAIYRTIQTNMDRVRLGWKDAGRPAFTSDDAEEAKALASVIAGCNLFLDYIYSAHSDDTSTASVAKDGLAGVSRAVIGAIYDAIAIAKAAGTAENSDWLRKILVLREKTLSYIDPASDAFMDAIRNKETWDNRSEIQFSALQDAAAKKLAAVPSHIFNAIIALAKTVVAHRAGRSDFSEVLNDKAESYIALNLFAQYISAGAVVQLTANPM